MFFLFFFLASQSQSWLPSILLIFFFIFCLSNFLCPSNSNLSTVFLLLRLRYFLTSFSCVPHDAFHAAAATASTSTAPTTAANITATTAANITATTAASTAKQKSDQQPQQQQQQAQLQHSQQATLPLSQFINALVFLLSLLSVAASPSSGPSSSSSPMSVILC